LREGKSELSSSGNCACIIGALRKITFGPRAAEILIFGRQFSGQFNNIIFHDAAAVAIKINET
jgi:hypothetical protein